MTTFTGLLPRKPWSETPSVVLARLNKDESVTVYERTGGASVTHEQRGGFIHTWFHFRAPSSREVRRHLTPEGLNYVMTHCWGQRVAAAGVITPLAFLALPARFLRET